jgi:pyruvate kinase
VQKFPLHVIGVLNSLVREVENRMERKSEKRTGRVVASPVVNALCISAISAAAAMRAKAFIVPSETGFTPRLLAKFRQLIPIIAVSPHANIVRQLRLVWGVQPLLCRRTLRQDDIIQLSVDTALKADYLADGDSVVGIVGNMDIPNAYNAVKLIVVGDIILKGQGIGDGIISGRVTIIKTLFDVNKRVKNKIVVAKATEAEHVKIIEEAAALIVEEGGLSSHAAITCLTLGKPVIVGADDALDLLVEDEQVTVDVMRGLVYRGWVNLG